MNAKFILAVSGAALLAPAQSFAATTTPPATSVQADVTVVGRVASLCVLGTPSSPQIDVGQMAATSGTRVGKIATLPAQSVVLDGSFCNFGGTMLTVDATALTNLDDGGVAPPANFARAVNYTATASNWAGINAAATTAALGDGSSATKTGLGGTQGTPKLSAINLEVSNFTVPTDSLMVSGRYQGAVRITLGPAGVE